MKEELLKLFADYLEDLDCLEKEEKLIFMRLAAEEGMLPFFYDCIYCLAGMKEKAEMESKYLSFSYEKDCQLLWGKESVNLKEEEAGEMFAKLIDLFEAIHPLGTMVELKEEFTKSLNLKNKNSKLRVVIVERFAETEDKQAYFPYVGVVYPIGTLGKGKFLHFSSSLIDSVIHEGYHDDMEDAYVLLMKKKLLIDYGGKSFGFLTKEEMEAYRDEMGV